MVPTTARTASAASAVLPNPAGATMVVFLPSRSRAMTFAFSTLRPKYCSAAGGSWWGMRAGLAFPNSFEST